MSKFNIQRTPVTTLIDVSENNTTGVSSATELNGLLVGIHTTAPDLTSTNTYTVTIKDADGHTIYNKAALAENTTTSAFIDANNHPLRLPLSGNHTVTIVSSGAEAADRTFTTKLLIQRG